MEPDKSPKVIAILVIVCSALIFVASYSMYDHKMKLETTDNNNCSVGVWEEEILSEDHIEWRSMPYIRRVASPEVEIHTGIWFRERLKVNRTYTYKDHGPFFHFYDGQIIELDTMNVTVSIKL